MQADLLINPGHRHDVIVPNDRNDDDLEQFSIKVEVSRMPK
jgi:hypothetical protein